MKRKSLMEKCELENIKTFEKKNQQNSRNLRRKFDENN